MGLLRLQLNRKHGIIVALVMVYLLGMNLWAEGPCPSRLSTKQFLYFFSQYGLLLLVVGFLVVTRRAFQALWQDVIEYWKKSVVPTAAKWVVLFVLAGQLVHVGLGLPIYPFYDVGMFRWAQPNKKLPDVCGQYRYYWKDSGGNARVWRPRRQHIEWPPDIMGWGWNNEMTFPMTYHWPHHPKNYEYTIKVLREKIGVKELYLGVETVNFHTGEVRFYENPEDAPPETFFAGWWQRLFHPSDVK
jgi:hypothetical protein